MKILMRDSSRVISDSSKMSTCPPEPIFIDSSEVVMMGLIEQIANEILPALPRTVLFTGEPDETWFWRALPRIYISLILWFYSILSFKITSQLKKKKKKLDSRGSVWLIPPALQLLAERSLCLSFNYHFYCHRTPSNSIIVTAVVTDSPGKESVKHTQAWIKHHGCMWS